MYKIQLSERAKIDLAKLKRSEPIAFKKAKKLLLELMDCPKSGTGQPEQLKFDLTGYWSRIITRKHRIIYTINEKIVTVLILSSYGHYLDK